ncbi:hypothetical protein ACWDKQ_14620 [Saccharopolyspora sp. NPDC000995]
MPTDLSIGQLAAIRAATDLPLDIYVAAPDELGGFVRHFEIAEIVRVAARCTSSSGCATPRASIRAAPSWHRRRWRWAASGCARAQIGLDTLRRYAPDAGASQLPAEGLSLLAIGEST